MHRPSRALTRLRPGQIVPAIPHNAEPRTGLDGGPPAICREWGIGREEQDELAVASHRTWPPPTTAGFSRTGDPLHGPRARPEPAPRLERREAREAEARVRRSRGDDDRRQLDSPADGSSPCCSPATSGPRPTASGARVLPDAETAAVDPSTARGCSWPRLSRFRGCWPERGRPRGLRLLRDPRGVRGAGAVPLAAWEDAVFCRERLGLDAALGPDRPRQAGR